MTSFRGCQQHVKAVEVGKLRTEGLSYAEALRRVKRTGEPARLVAVKETTSQ